MVDLNWKEDGAEIVKGLFSASIVNNCREKILTIEKNADDLAGEFVFESFENRKHIRYIPNCHYNVREFITFFNSEVLKFSSRFLNDKVYFWDSDFHSRVGRDAEETPPHQDSFLKCLENGHEYMLTCYIALTDIPVSSNAMKVIKGSHKQDTLHHKRSLKLGFSSVIEEDADSLPNGLLRNEVDVPLKAGDALFFHSKLIHYTKRRINISDIKKRRMALAIRIFGDKVRFSEERKKIYIKNVEYNRNHSINLGLTKKSPTKVDSAYN